MIGKVNVIFIAPHNRVIPNANSAYLLCTKAMVKEHFSEKDFFKH